MHVVTRGPRRSVLALVVVRFQFAGIVLMIVRAVLIAMLVVMTSIGIVGMLVRVAVLVLMTVLVGVLVRMRDITVRVFVGVSVLVRVLVLMLVFVFPFHSSPHSDDSQLTNQPHHLIGECALAVRRAQYAIDGIRSALGGLVEVSHLQFAQQPERDQLHTRHNQHRGKYQ